MPLSEHEQRLLDQIERALYQEDPKFASSVRATDLRTHMRRRLRRAGLVLALGFALLLAGLIGFGTSAIGTVIGIAGFIVMVGALLLAMSSWRRLQPTAPDLHVAGSPERPAKPARQGRSKPQKSSSGSGGSFKDKLEERWKRRWDERGGER